MSPTLFKANIRTNRFIWLLIMAIYSFYTIILVSMYDPDSIEALMSMMEMMPKEMVDAMGYSFGTTFVTYLAGIMYSMLLYLFPMIITIVVNHRLIASHVDKGSMAYLISTGNSRKKIVVTQALFSIVSITAVFTFITILAIVMATIMFPGELEVGKFILLNVYALLLYFAISGICFFASAIASESKHSIGLGAGIPIGFVVLEMIGNAGDKFNWIGNFSLFTLFNPDRLFAGDNFAYFGMGAFLVLAIILYYGAITIFGKRDLSI